MSLSTSSPCSLSDCKIGTASANFKRARASRIARRTARFELLAKSSINSSVSALFCAGGPLPRARTAAAETSRLSELIRARTRSRSFAVAPCKFTLARIAACETLSSAALATNSAAEVDAGSVPELAAISDFKFLAMALRTSGAGSRIRVL